MKKLLFSVVPAMLLLAGCQVDSVDNERGGGVAPVDPKKTEWEALPTGKNFLYQGDDSNGVPQYLPVRFQDSSAIAYGDIAIATGAEQLAALRATLVDPAEGRPAGLAKSSGNVKNSTFTGGANAWPGGFIPYAIGGGLATNMVEQAVYEFNQASGISYVPLLPSDKAYVVFIPTYGPASFSAVGLVTQNAAQTINIKPGSTRGTIIHEMCHAAGMYHEQMRDDRDLNVTVTTSGVDDMGIWDANWKKVGDGTKVGTYDFQSIMHYTAGTNTYVRSNGQFYTVTMTAKYGNVLGGQTPTATDKLSLWNIAANGFPFRPQGVKQLTGKITKLYNTTYQSETKKWIVIYDPVTGNANVNAINADNTYGSSMQNFNVGTGFNLISPYTSASSQNIMFYSSVTGAVKLYKLIPAGGVIDPVGLIANGVWNKGWSSIDYYTSAFKDYWFFFNKTTGEANIWAVASNGGLGLNTWASSWPGWNYARPFYSETSAYGPEAFVVCRMPDGYTRIRKLPGDGTLGATVANSQLPSSPAVGVYQSVSKAILALAGNNGLFLVDMDHTGFSSRGTPIFRASSLPSTVTRMDAASDFYTTNASGTIINNKVFDFKHVLTFEYQSLPGAVFVGWGAPFH